MDPDLSILLFEDCEKPPDYLNYYFHGLKEWNANGLDKTQIILITQKSEITTAEQACQQNGINAEIIKADNEFVAGKPIWDVISSIRKAWPKVTGKYITINHSEFLWCKDRLQATIQWLRDKGIYLALGNLRRPASMISLRARIPFWRPDNCEKRVSDALMKLLAKDRWQYASQIAEEISTTWWPLWNVHGPVYDSASPWQEDVFFADKQWLDSWCAFDHGGELPFQDVWDIMGEAIRCMAKKNLAPTILRMPQEINRIIHFWHPKGYQSWTPEIRDYFLNDPKRWHGTWFLNQRLWAQLIRINGSSRFANQIPKYELRRGPGGTTTKYISQFENHLNNSGSIALTKFYQTNGREYRGSKCRCN